MSGTQVHHLKAWPEWFRAVQKGLKTFEVRRDDRGFMRGDLLELCEYLPSSRKFTGRVCKTMAVEVYRGLPGVEPGYVVIELGQVTNCVEPTRQERP